MLCVNINDGKQVRETQEGVRGGMWFVAGSRMQWWRRRSKPFPLNKSHVVNVLIYVIPTYSSCHNRSNSNHLHTVGSPCVYWPGRYVSSPSAVKRRQRGFPLACAAAIGVELPHSRMLRATVTETSATFMSDLATQPVFTPHARTQRQRMRVGTQNFTFISIKSDRTDWCKVGVDRPPPPCALTITDCMVV